MRGFKKVLGKLLPKQPSGESWPMISVKNNEELCKLLQFEKGIGSAQWSPEFEALIHKLQHPYQALTSQEEVYIRSDTFQTEIAKTSKTINTLLSIARRSGQCDDYLLDDRCINPGAVIAQHQHAYAPIQAEIEKVVDKISSQKTKLQQLQNQIQSNNDVDTQEKEENLQQVEANLTILNGFLDIDYENITQITERLDGIDQIIKKMSEMQKNIKQITDEISSQKIKLTKLSARVISDESITNKEQHQTGIKNALSRLNGYTNIKYTQLGDMQSKLKDIANATKFIHTLPNDRLYAYNEGLANHEIVNTLLGIRDRSGKLICKNGNVNNILALLNHYMASGGVEYDTIPGLTGVTRFPKITGPDVVNTFYPMNIQDLKSITGKDLKKGCDDDLCRIYDAGSIKNKLYVSKSALCDENNNNTLACDQWINQDSQGNPNYIRKYALHLQKHNLTLNKKNLHNNMLDQLAEQLGIQAESGADKPNITLLFMLLTSSMYGYYFGHDHSGLGLSDADRRWDRDSLDISFSGVLCSGLT